MIGHFLTKTHTCDEGNKGFIPNIDRLLVHVVMTLGGSSQSSKEMTWQNAGGTILQYIFSCQVEQYLLSFEFLRYTT